MHPGQRSAKQGVRRAVRAARAAAGTAERDRVAAALADRVPALVAVTGQADEVGHPLTVAAYVSLPGEPGTGLLRQTLRAAGHRVLLPWLRDDLDLDWVVDDGREPTDPLHPSGARLGVQALLSADLVLVPALAVDAAGTRLGQGGGSYDRALARLADRRPPPVVLAVVHDDELLPGGALPAEPHDVGVDGALTPGGLHVGPSHPGEVSRTGAAPDARGRPPRPPRG